MLNNSFIYCCYYYYFVNSFLLINWSIYAKSDNNITANNRFSYSATISPPGHYAIAVWDKYIAKNDINYCNNLFEKIRIEANVKTRKLFKCFFKYYQGLGLTHFAECFRNFFIAQSNENGEFNVTLNDTMPEIINFQIFPLNKQKELIRSNYLPTTFLQNSLEASLKWNTPDDVMRTQRIFHFLNNAEKKWMLSNIFSNFLWSNDNNVNLVPSDAQAFFIKAFFHEITAKIVDTYTLGTIFTSQQLVVLQKYGKMVIKWQTNGTLVTKLAQIDGMENLLRNFCTFFLGDFHYDSTINYIQIKCYVWHIFCNEFVGKMPTRKSMMERLNIAPLDN